MKILAPFDSVSEASTAVSAGADELYCGFLGEHWSEKGLFSNARHMSYGNLGSLDDLKKSIGIAAEAGIPVYLCVNDYLAREAYNMVLEDIDQAVLSGVKGVIVADLSLAGCVKKNFPGCMTALSCLNPVFSSQAMEFIARNGIDRVIFPLNQLSLEEISSLTDTACGLGMETEVFLNNVSCMNMPGNCLFNTMDVFSDSFSTGMRSVLAGLRFVTKNLPVSVKGVLGRHLFSSGLHPKPCRKKTRIEIMDTQSRRILNVIRYYSPEKEFADKYCGLCAVYNLHKLGITSGKIAGRGYPSARKTRDLNYMREFIDAIHSGRVNDDNYLSFGMELLSRIYGIDCSSLSCHYGLRKSGSGRK